MIPDDVLKRAAEEAAKTDDPHYWDKDRDNVNDIYGGPTIAKFYRYRHTMKFVEPIRSALPILVPVIRADLIHEMMEHTHSWIIIKDDEQGELMDAWLADYLPITGDDQS